MKKLLKVLMIAGCFGILCGGLYAQQGQETPRDGVYDKIQTGQREVIPYAHLREGDVMWSKRIWRVIDLRQKINLPFYYPIDEQEGRKSLMQILYSAVLEGTIHAYDVDNDEFRTPLQGAAIQKRLDRQDTMTLTRSYPPYADYDTVISEPFRTSNVFLLRIKEDWFFDRQRSVMDVRILGICPITEDYDPTTGDFRGYAPLFWVYFPECRAVFVKSEVFNRWNDAERRTYDDVFFKRTFGSYIYKESNVYDRKIIQYAKGLDGLLEAERIKQELFKVEHDLWEF